MHQPLPHPRRFKALLLRLGHHALSIWLSMMLLSFTIPLLPRSIPGWVWYIVLAYLAFGLLTYLIAGPYHDRRLCVYCITEMPRKGAELAERRHRELKFAHWVNGLLAGFIFLLLIAGSSYLHKPWSTVFAELLAAFTSYWAFSSIVHRRLQPWCPDCHWGDGGGGPEEPVLDPTPDPTHSRQLQ